MNIDKKLSHCTEAFEYLALLVLNAEKDQSMSQIAIIRLDKIAEALANDLVSFDIKEYDSLIQQLSTIREKLAVMKGKHVLNNIGF